MSKTEVLRSLAAVIGELAYLRGWIVILGKDGVRYKMTDLHKMALRDLYSGSKASKDALLEEAYWWEDDPRRRTGIMRQTPEGPVVWLLEVAPWE